MIYFRGHVQALEAQIGRQEQSHQAELSRLEQLHQSQISRLEQLLGEERAERKSLLDRLLEKKNIEPLQEKPQPTPPPIVELISPAGAGATPEMVDAYRESWIAEEAAYQQGEHGYTDAQARELAERNYVEQHKAL